ncbi:MAG: DUF5119 domain-containing protein [Prevotella sp.]|jgi:hypothetical protein|nr:DUF5119 domain-containing protein [Prevotella sp.]
MKKQINIPCEDSIFRPRSGPELQVANDTKRPGARKMFAGCLSFKLSTFYFLACCLLFSGCLRELSPDDPCQQSFGDKAVRVVIHWDDVPAASRPNAMSVFWYSGGQSPFIGDYGSAGGYERLPGGLFTPLCIDFYGNSGLDFRNTGILDGFEIYNVSRTSLYNNYADPVPGEATVAEAVSPYTCYVDGEAQVADTRSLVDGDTLTVDFYPVNVLREFTFLIYGVDGAKNIARSSGAISGMSASYFPASKNLADAPSTVLFTRVTPVQNGQTYSWSSAQKALFAQKNPDWQSSDPNIGWTGDWVTGRFSTFGPVDVNNPNIRLTVEALTGGSRYYYGAWGYWFGKWDDTVGFQIREALGGISGQGTIDEQLAWRGLNGGYDIVLSNDGRLVVPEDPDTPSDSGGFIVGSDDWGGSISVPGGH